MNKLQENTVIEYLFPELPSTLHMMCNKISKPPKMLVGLPIGYSLKNTYLIFIFLNGGTGAAGVQNDIEYVKKLTGNEGFILVSMPLFKNEVDPNEFLNGIFINASDDYQIISSSYKIMLSKLFDEIPKIDKGNGVISGFSNGGNTIALLLSNVDDFILNNFKYFILWEGGLVIMSFNKLKVNSKNFLYVLGDKNDTASRKRIANIGKSLREEVIDFTGANIDVIKMHGIGHEHPDEYIPCIKNWVMEKIK